MLHYCNYKTDRIFYPPEDCVIYRVVSQALIIKHCKSVGKRESSNWNALLQNTFIILIVNNWMDKILGFY